MKYRSGGSTPPKPTPAERAAGAKFRESIKNIKPTPAQGKILDKTGKKMAKGGKVKKMAFGGTSLPFKVANSLNKTLNPRTPAIIGPSANKANAIANSDKLQQGAAAKAAQGASTAPARTPTNIGRLNMGHAKGGKVKKMAVGGMPAGASATTTARPTTTAAKPAVSSSGPITRENLAARKAANTAAKVARGNITGTAAAASAPKLGPITRENLAARKAANTAAKIARGNTTGMAKGGKATKFGKALVKKSADTMGRAMVKKAGGGKCYASGGLVAGHKSADGIAKKGKTKTSMAKMARGGKTC
jgi:hypothetical protein